MERLLFFLDSFKDYSPGIQVFASLITAFLTAILIWAYPHSRLVDSMKIVRRERDEQNVTLRVLSKLFKQRQHRRS